MIRVSVLLVVGCAIAVAGCGSSPPVATATGGCKGVARDGSRLAPGLTPTTLCRARGRPLHIVLVHPDGALWGYRDGTIVLFRRGRAAVVQHHADGSFYGMSGVGP